MLEIFILFHLTRSLMNKATVRGASQAWAGLGPLLWLGGEFSAYFAAGGLGHEGLVVYPFALGYAGLGAWLAHSILDRVPGSEST